MKTILITGGAGFLGTQTVLRLAAEPHNELFIRVLDAAPLAHTAYAKAKNIDINYIQGDMTRLSDFSKACAGADVIIHLARSEDLSMAADLLDYNCSMADNISRYASSAKLEKIILASSFQVYGKNATAGITENAVCLPITDYARSKYLCENMLDRLSMETGISTVILRYFNIYGSFASTGILKLLSDKLAARQAPVDPIDLALRNDGEDGRDYIHIHDAVSALLHALSYPNQSKERMSSQDYNMAKSEVCPRFNVGTGRCTTVRSLLQLFEKSGGTKISVRYGTGQDPIRSVSADCSRMAGLLGMDPVISLEEGIKAMICAPH